MMDLWLFSETKLRTKFDTIIERYGIKVENIEELISEKNSDYILNPTMFWYKYFDDKEYFFSKSSLLKKLIEL